MALTLIGIEHSRINFLITYHQALPILIVSLLCSALSSNQGPLMSQTYIIEWGIEASANQHRPHLGGTGYGAGEIVRPSNLAPSAQDIETYYYSFPRISPDFVRLFTLQYFCLILIDPRLILQTWQMLRRQTRLS